MKQRFTLLLCFLAAGIFSAFGCTSANVSPERSATGEVMIWKHRDYPMRHTGVRYVTGGKYAYTAVMSPGGCYGGLNEAGLGVTQNAVHNLRPGDSNGKKYQKHEHSLITTALRECATLDEFEAMLKNYFPCEKGFQTMLDLCDAQGNCAFFEISQNTYKRFNARDTKDGFVVRSNFGFSGEDSTRGTSQRRYDIMYKQMSEHKGKFQVNDFVNYSRNFESVQFGNVLKSDDVYYDENYTVSRRTSCADIIILSGKNPRMFVCNGNSVVGYVVPVYVGGAIPKCVQIDEIMYKNSEKYLAKAYKQEGEKYSLNKPLVRALNKKNKFKVYDPGLRPADTQSIADKMDAIYDKMSKKLNAVMDKF